MEGEILLLGNPADLRPVFEEILSALARTLYLIVESPLLALWTMICPNSSIRPSGRNTGNNAACIINASRVTASTYCK